MTACRQIEEFVDGLSNWYVRRSRRRFWKQRVRRRQGRRLRDPLDLPRDGQPPHGAHGALHGRGHVPEPRPWRPPRRARKPPPLRVARRDRSPDRPRALCGRPSRPAPRIAGPRRPLEGQHPRTPAPGHRLRQAAVALGGDLGAAHGGPDPRRAQREGA